MSGLARVLAGKAPPGVYQWHAAHQVPDVEHAVDHAGWGFGYVDGWHLGSKQEWLEAVGLALDFPDHYGRNLDALADCLSDLGGHTVLLWDGWSTLARADEGTFASVLHILGSAAPERLTVLLRGEGPELDVPSLD